MLEGLGGVLPKKGGYSPKMLGSLGGVVVPKVLKWFWFVNLRLLLILRFFG